MKTIKTTKTIKNISNFKLAISKLFSYLSAFIFSAISIFSTISVFIVSFAFIASFFTTDLTFAANIPTNVNIKPSLSLTMPSTAELVLDPASSPFSSHDVNIVVGTNNPTGYWLTMSSDTTALVSDDDDTSTIDTLPAKAEGYTEAEFIANKWGYKVGVNGSSSTNYLSYTPGVVIAKSNTIANGDNITLTLGTKIDYLQPSGKYEMLLNIKALPSVTTNYIQNLDSTLCTEEPMVVIDSRDEQTYIIQRLKDDKCWMMTNLNLGAYPLTQDLTSANTNIQTPISASEFNGWKVERGTGSRVIPEYIPLNISNTTDGLASDPVSETPYGTLYNYCATSANTICSVSSSSDASYSLCPSGWRLPTSGDNGEFQNLYSQSSYNSLNKMHAPISSDGAAFAFAGDFDANLPDVQGTYATYWSSTHFNSINVYTLTISAAAGKVNPSAGFGRWLGRSIRCILNE